MKTIILEELKNAKYTSSKCPGCSKPHDYLPIFVTNDDVYYCQCPDTEDFIKIERM